MATSAGTWLVSAGRASIARKHLLLQYAAEIGRALGEARVSELAAYHLVCPNPANPHFRLPGWLSISRSVT